ncbi:hypothetical protein TNCV_2154251 [Trichonephila clavipes]|nr:hypothetical protein TNCV_2154251 [Trichonephila clavipes]
MARIVRHNDESVREGYIRNGGKEVKIVPSPQGSQLQSMITLPSIQPESSLYALSHAKKPRKFPILTKHVSHASLIPSSN